MRCQASNSLQSPSATQLTEKSTLILPLATRLVTCKTEVEREQTREVPRSKLPDQEEGKPLVWRHSHVPAGATEWRETLHHDELSAIQKKNDYKKIGNRTDLID